MMSKRNGDRARFAREQKKKRLRRKRNLELRKEMESRSTEGAAPNTDEAEPKIEPAD
jgi:hypothetical protein